MLTLSGIQEALVLTHLVCTVAWLVHFQWGFSWSRPSSRHVNFHTLSLTVCFALLWPQEKVMTVILQRASRTTKQRTKAALRVLAMAFFVHGIIEIYRVENRKVLLPSAGPDQGIHLVLSLWSMGMHLVGLVTIILVFVKRHVPMSGTTWTALECLSDANVIEALNHLIDLSTFLATLSGFLSYVINIDLAIMNKEDLPSAATSSNQQIVFLLIMATLAGSFVLNTCISYYLHHLQHHFNIITYRMFVNDFLKICDSLKG